MLPFGAEIPAPQLVPWIIDAPQFFLNQIEYDLGTAWPRENLMG